VARILVLTPDLLFGSGLLGALVAGGHSAILCSDADALAAEASGASLVIVDLTDSVEERSAILTDARDAGLLDGVKALGYYSHVDPESRDLGLKAGIEQVVPRSRMHREPTALVDALLSD